MSGPDEKRRLSPQLLHDLRSPLSQIIGYSEMLGEDSAEDSAASIDLQRIRAAGHSLLELIDGNFTAGVEREEAIRAAPRSRTTELPRPAASTSEPGSILVVDDQAGNREMLKRRLERQGHEVATADDGPQALALLPTRAFDLVLLDILMPGMDGYEVLRQIKQSEALRQVPVIMISAINEVQSVVRCIEAGAEDYLTKPFDPTLLRARVDATLQRKRGRDRENALFGQLQENFRRLEETEKLRDDLRNMIVHDLRTPLTSLLVGIEMLSYGGGLDPTQQEIVELAVGGGRTLLGMINDLLEVEKMEGGAVTLDYADVDASRLVADTIAQVTALALQNDTRLVGDVASPLPSFAADEKKISRTLVNLIGNAIKFTRGGTVTIAASMRDAEHIAFSVQDTGNGIPPEAFLTIFEKFTQLDSKHHGGTGLGLAFCKLAVEAHGGTISVASTPGAGSTFTFALPLRPTAA